MRLKVTDPSSIALEAEVSKVCAEGEHGEFCLLPRHMDFVAALRSSLLSAVDESGQEVFLAVNGGLLVKCGEEVLVSTPQAVRGSLGELEKAIEESFEQLDQRERQARQALEKMQADFVRQFIELQAYG